MLLSLECPICLEKYVNNDKSEKAPKILSCGHTFCCKCIKEIMKKDNYQIICCIDREKENRAYEKIPFNRIIFDLEKQQKKIEIENRKIDYRLNIGMIGNNFVGKTSLSNCYEKNEPYVNVSYPTIGLDYFRRVININGKKIQVTIWNTTGDEKFNALTSSYLRTLHGCFIVFDVTDNDSFENLVNWIQLYKDYNQYKKKLMIILGNKVDIEERVIQSKEAINFAKERDLPYFETSSKTMHNVNEALEKMVKMILESQNENNLKRSESRFRLKYHNQKKVLKRGCC